MLFGERLWNRCLHYQVMSFGVVTTRPNVLIADPKHLARNVEDDVPYLCLETPGTV